MDNLSIVMLVLIATIGVYKLVDGFKGTGFALTAINLHLDAIKKNGTNDSERIIALLIEQNALLVRLVEHQRGK